MTNIEMASLRKTYVSLCMYYGRQLDDTAISMYVEDLSDLALADVETAILKYRRDPKNKTIPLPAHLRSLVGAGQTPRDLAEATLLRVMDAIKQFGWCNPNEAKLFVGDIGWRVIAGMGGWRRLCEDPDFNIGVFRAQFINSAETLIKYEDQTTLIASAPALALEGRG